MTGEFPRSVQLEYMRPAQVEAAGRRFPVVYAPFGLIEWLNDTLHRPAESGSVTGIGGLDPRQHGSVEVGRRNVEFAAEAIGRKACELLASLPEDKRGFGVELRPDKWWMI